MYRYKKFVHLFVFAFIVSVSFKVGYHPFVIDDINRASEVLKTVVKTEDALHKEIIEKGSVYMEAPQNAYIDKVWKKTTGRNGIKVDTDASYKNMKKDGIYKESLLVFDHTLPSIRLKDLPPSPIFRGHPEKEMVALFINVSWGTEHIPAILNILKEHKVKATFFIEGKWAKENADLVKMIDEQEHIIGNHAYNHPDMQRISSAEIKEQIEQTNNIIEAIIDKRPKWFAPPSGSFTNQVVEIADSLKMETVLWTVDTVDWKNPSVSVMMNRVFTNVHPGATILMHPTRVVVEGLSPMIKEIKAREYRIDTIEALLSEDR